MVSPCSWLIPQYSWFTGITNSLSWHVRTMPHCWIHFFFVDAFLLQGCTYFPKPSSQLKIIGARRVTWNKFHSEDPQISVATIQNLVAQVTSGQKVLHPCSSRTSTITKTFLLLFVPILHFVPMTNEDLNATTCRTPYRRCCMVSSPPQCYKGHGMGPHALAFVDLSPVYHLNGCYSCLQCGWQDWIWGGDY